MVEASRVSQQQKVEILLFKGHFNSTIMFCYVVDKLWQVGNGRQGLTPIVQRDVNVLERWGDKPLRESVQDCATATIAESR